MNGMLRLPGFPPPEKQNIVRFHVLRSLSYPARIILFLVFLLAGFAVQFFTLRVWPGALFLIFASAIVLVRGYDSRVEVKSDPDDGWTQVGMDKLNRIKELDRKAAEWDRDILDISNLAGFFTFLVTLSVLVIVYLSTRDSYFYRETGVIFVSDAIILIVPMWFTGIRRIPKQGNLLIKVDIIKQMEAYFRLVKKDGENFVPLLMLAKDKTGKSIPTDCKFAVTFDNMPDGFYGIQAQVNINLVQGTGYPYFYCVIVAKPGFGLDRHAREIVAPKGITIDYNENSNAEVIVIRQTTTKTSGYHTKINDCKKILAETLAETRKILSSTQKVIKQ